MKDWELEAKQREKQIAAAKQKVAKAMTPAQADALSELIKSSDDLVNSFSELISPDYDEVRRFVLATYQAARQLPHRGDNLDS